MVGPNTGARTIGALLTAITRGISAGPAARTTIIEPTGTAIPAMPCTDRKTISQPTESLNPQASEARVNRPTAARNTRRAPSRVASQALIGITAAMASR